MAYTITQGIQNLIDDGRVSKLQMQDIMREVMSGQTSESQLASFLTAARIRGETPEMIAGAASIMREFANHISPNITGQFVDTCGTGGDNSQTFNISTVSAIVAAGAGVTVCKHGNRSITSKCGSADLLEGFGVNVMLEPKKVEQMINEIGIGFMFAPKFHPAMKYAMPVRRSLGIRTIFNILGPLTNPAGARAHVLGVYKKELVNPIAEVMKELGGEKIYVVHSDPGIDEIVPINRVYITEVNEGKITAKTFTAKDFGMNPTSLSAIKGGNLPKNLAIAKAILNNEDQGIKRQIVLLNAAYAIMAAGLAQSLSDARQKAEKSITSGQALEKLKMMVKASQGEMNKFNASFP